MWSMMSNNSFLKTMMMTLLFLKKVCEGRDKSHGFEHGVTVFKLGLMMYMYDVAMGYVTLSKRVIELIVIAGALHDVNDEKYKLDENNLILTNELTDFLIKTVGEDDAMIILHIIENVSWKKEMRKREKLNVHQYWLSLLGENGYIALMYIMDADRNESLWKTGHDRSKDYNTKHSLKEGEGDKELYWYVNSVIEEKLKRLDEYCYTPSGKTMALRGREELCRVHTRWFDQLNL